MIEVVTFPGDTDVPAVQQEGLTSHDFEIFVRDYAGRLQAVARRFFFAEEDAADALQEAFLAAFAARSRFHGDSTVYTWLYRIVVNVCLMKLRSRARAHTVSLDEVLQLGGVAGSLTSPSEQVEQLAEREELRAAVRACIDRLPEEHRTILWLRDMEQLNTAQTARRLNLSAAAVKTRLHRARRALRRRLEQHVTSP